MWLALLLPPRSPSCHRHPCLPPCLALVPTAALHCPILLLLHRHLELTWVAAARAAAATVPSSASLSALNTMSAALSRTAGGLWETNAPAAALAGPPVVPPAHHGWMIAAAKRAAPELASLEASAVSIMDALHTAGYRIHIYRGEARGGGGGGRRCFGTGVQGSLLLWGGMLGRAPVVGVSWVCP